MIGDCSTDSKTEKMSEGRGMIPRFCENLVSRMEAKKKEDMNISFTIQASYMEIYEEKIFESVNFVLLRRTDSGN